MAQAAALSMAKGAGGAGAMSDNNWSSAYTRSLLGVKLNVAGTGAWSLVTRSTRQVVTPRDRLPDYLLHTPQGHEARVHDLCAGKFTALNFADARRRPLVPLNSSPALQQFLMSRYYAPLDSGQRERSMLDPGSALFKRPGIAPGTLVLVLVLVRPDEHIAAIVPMEGGASAARFGGRSLRAAKFCDHTNQETWPNPSL